MANDRRRPDPVYPGSTHRFNGAGTLYSQFSCGKRSGTAGDLHPACTEISAKKTYRLEQGRKIMILGSILRRRYSPVYLRRLCGKYNPPQIRY